MGKEHPEKELVEGIKTGLEDFINGRCKKFETVEEMIADLNDSSD